MIQDILLRGLKGPRTIVFPKSQMDGYEKEAGKTNCMFATRQCAAIISRVSSDWNNNNSVWPPGFH